MPKFAYEALDSKGRVIQGTLDAPNVEAVIEELRNIKYTVTNVRQEADVFSFLKDFRNKFQRVDLEAMAIFTRQFATIFNSGMPIVRGLEGLAKQTMNRKLAASLQEVYQDVRGGFALAKALAKHPDVFSPVYVSLVKAGEMAGAMGEILDRLASLLEKEYGLRKRVQAAMTYPITIFIGSCLVTFFMVTHIFPSFVGLLEGLDMKLPWPTQLLIFITRTLKEPLFILPFLTVLGVVGYLLSKYLNTSVGKRQFDYFMLNLPVVGMVNKKVALSRFCRTLGTLLGSGVPMIHALEIVGRVAGNEIISDIIDQIKMGLKAGMRLSQPLREYKLFPPMLPQMVSVGEETGNLSGVLSRLASFYDTEVEHALDAFTSMLEPLMIFSMGMLVGFILLAVFVPVYQIMQKF